MVDESCTVIPAPKIIAMLESCGMILSDAQVSGLHALFGEPITLVYSRRYKCPNCGHKGRVAKSARSRYLRCANCHVGFQAKVVERKASFEE